MPRLRKMLDHLLGHRSRANNQRAVTLQVAKHALRELHARQSY